MQSQKRLNNLCSFEGKPFNVTVSKSMPQPVMLKKLKWNGYEDLQDLLELTPKKDVLCITGDWNEKVGSQETPGVTGRFGLGV